ncbi:MAG: translation initiation factor IF-2 [Lentimonas sp.]|jgi:translation initiation factor IF-2
MSVRIHQLAKQIGMENKELLELLRSRGFEVKSVSSTIDNISAESLVKELSSAEKAEESSEDIAEASQEETKPEAPAFPKGAIVKSANEIKHEREALAETKNAKEVAPAPKSGAPKASTPVVKAPPSTPSMSKAPPAAVAPAGKNLSTPPATPPLVKPQGSEPPKLSGPPKPPSAVAPKSDAPETSTVLEGSEEAATTESVEGEGLIIRAKTPIVVRDFATEIGVKPFKLISELMEMGIFASMNQTIEETVAQQIAKRHGFTLEIHHRGETQSDKESAKKKKEKVSDDDPRFLKTRPPVVCILGHVDHGKTTLLDTIRKASVTSGEAGGITQHIGAYQVEHNERKITFLDTPGHAAFSKMRSRGTNVTDIAVIVIAADDAFKPQTEEALRFAKEANNSIVIAINKIDSKGANIDRVKQQMQEKGIAPEDWGGETIAVEISALQGTNINELLDMILLQAEILELKANPDCPASGTIIEAQFEEGRGATASVIIERGTLKKGDALICGEAYCKVKLIMDENGELLKEAPPATPVKVVGWSEIPESGGKFSALKNEKAAKKAVAEATENRKQQENAPPINSAKQEVRKATVEDLFAAIARQKKKCLNVIVKSDVHGSTEALASSLEEIISDKVDLRIISKGVGHISKNDVALASASEEDVTILGFNVRLDNGVQSQAKHHDVRIIQHDVIYELIDQAKECMAELLDPDLREKKLGVAEVRQVFSISKYRKVAGCMVTQGTINRMRKARLMRGGKVIHEGNVDTLKRFKDDVKEVRAGFECGINIEGYDDYQEGDTIECVEVEKIRASL